MSHSTCLVIVRKADGPEHAEHLAEQMLAPFNEGLEVPHDVWGDTDRAALDECFWWRDNERLNDANRAEYEAEFITRHGVEPDRQADRQAWEYWVRDVIKGYHGCRAIFDGDRIGYVSNYNPRSKWDSYALGGRWHGFWPIKAGVGANVRLGRPGTFGNLAEVNTADIAQKRDIDFDYKRREKVIAAEREYDAWEALTAGIDYADHRSWDDICEQYAPDYDSARQVYGAQPLVAALRTRRGRESFGIVASADDFVIGREAYVKRAEESALSTFAVLDGGDWYEQGDMGWFGMVADEKDPETWNRTFSSLVDPLPDDAWLAVYDLHI